MPPPLNRPLSPFMFPVCYRFQITSALSILHRLTGIALAVGSILLAWWLVSVAAGGELFAATHAFIVSPIGLLLLLGWSIPPRIAPSSTAHGNASFASAAPPRARATGGTRTNISARRSCCSPIAGWPTAAISAPASASTGSRTRSASIAATPS
jgi:Succinate dehydrogenase/Fumarate reductase transmembrane subunit